MQVDHTSLVRIGTSMKKDYEEEEEETTTTKQTDSLSHAE